VVPLRPEVAMCEATLCGWRAQPGLQDSTIAPREKLVRAFVEFTNEYPRS
jgi:integrase/recombinase XerC